MDETDPRTGGGTPVRMSVVVPAYNEAATLGATLTSLAAQDYPGDVEVIVVDNGSTDATAAVAREHGVRVLTEPQRGVCRARQLGTLSAGGDLVVSTDADTRHPPDWLSRVAAAFEDDVVAVAGPCRYEDPPWWARIFPPLYFAAIGLRYRLTGRIGYITATNVAFRREGFPGYDTTLTQGGDEVDLLRRLRRWGHVRWVPDLVVLTSARRMNQGLAHTVLVSYGYHYATNLLVNRLTSRPLLGPAPAIREDDQRRSSRQRWAWRTALTVLVGGLVVRRLRRRTSAHPGTLHRVR